MKKHLTTILLVLLLVAGAGLLIYPSFADYWNSFHQSRAIASYVESVSSMSQEDYQVLWDAAREFNQSLVGRPAMSKLSDEEKAAYYDLLRVGSSGVIGYINIPKINVNLPFYHGTDESVLQVAVGHVEGSSLPTGEISTHCVLSGHRGLPSAKLFTDLNQLSEGDIFILQVLNETMTYEVDQIRVVLPHEVDDMAIQPGWDLCTLVTCTPYGINTHRLLVRGRRIANLAATYSIHITADAMRIDPTIVAPFAALPMLLVLMLWLMTSGQKGKQRKKAKKKLQQEQSGPKTAKEAPKSTKKEPKDTKKAPKAPKKGKRQAPGGKRLMKKAHASHNPPATWKPIDSSTEGKETDHEEKT